MHVCSPMSTPFYTEDVHIETKVKIYQNMHSSWSTVLGCIKISQLLVYAMTTYLLFLCSYWLLHEFQALNSFLETWGMLHNHQGHCLRWLCNISKVSTNNIESVVQAIIDLDYGWLWCKSYQNKCCSICIAFVLIRL